jgi:hypothetical protein
LLAPLARWAWPDFCANSSGATATIREIVKDGSRIDLFKPLLNASAAGRKIVPEQNASEQRTTPSKGEKQHLPNYGETQKNLFIVRRNNSVAKNRPAGGLPRFAGHWPG